MQNLNRGWMCKLCQAAFPTKAEIDRHVDIAHPKELAYAELTRIKGITDEANLSQQLLLKQAIADYTRRFLVDETDSTAMYTMDEVLGDTGVHQMWHNVMACGYPNCAHNEPAPNTVDKALIQFSRKGGSSG